MLFFNNTLPSVLLPAEKLHLHDPMTKEIVWHRDSVILALNHTDPFNQQKKNSWITLFFFFLYVGHSCVDCRQQLPALMRHPAQQEN